LASTPQRDLSAFIEYPQRPQHPDLHQGRVPGLIIAERRLRPVGIPMAIGGSARGGLWPCCRSRVRIRRRLRPRPGSQSAAGHPLGPSDDRLSPLAGMGLRRCSLVRRCIEPWFIKPGLLKSVLCARKPFVERQNVVIPRALTRSVEPRLFSSPTRDYGDQTSELQRAPTCGNGPGTHLSRDSRAASDCLGPQTSACYISRPK
jgi:hypothetical protein